VEEMPELTDFSILATLPELVNLAQMARLGTTLRAVMPTSESNYPYLAESVELAEMASLPELVKLAEMA